MVNRDRHDIVMEILEKSTSGKKKTELMTEVGLSYLQTRQYFHFLLEKGLLEIDAKHRFKTTKEGLEFIEKCKDCFLCHWHKQKKAKKLTK